jgi:hypothetical protein
VFDKLIQVLVFGCGYRRIADHTCSATTLRRRRDEWIACGVAERLHRLAVVGHDVGDRAVGLRWRCSVRLLAQDGRRTLQRSSTCLTVPARHSSHSPLL